eukprot:6413853-Prymnesium_polylepis.1
MSGRAARWQRGGCGRAEGRESGAARQRGVWRAACGVRRAACGVWRAAGWRPVGPAAVHAHAWTVRAFWRLAPV